MPTESKVPSVTNPLWIISLILGICQLTLGATTTLTAGWIQGLFAVFMVVYTAAVTAGFFYLLNSRAHVFYSPREYRGGASVQEYSQAVARAKVKAEAQAQVVAASTDLVFASVEKSLGEVSRDQELVSSVLASARSEVIRSAITVDLSTFDPSLGELTLPVSEHEPVSDFLNSIYFALPDTVPAYTYGETWLLRRPSDGKEFDKIGTKWAEESGERGRLGIDNRPLLDLGIEAGDKFEVVPSRQFKLLSARAQAGLRWTENHERAR